MVVRPVREVVAREGDVPIIGDGAIPVREEAQERRLICENECDRLIERETGSHRYGVEGGKERVP